MDYDDNDFQSQYLRLAGEGSAKFPPVLGSYALPKFDFDDSLQGHLRFDSLVETEAFFLALKVKKTTSGLRISLGEVVG